MKNNWTYYDLHPEAKVVEAAQIANQRLVNRNRGADIVVDYVPQELRGPKSETLRDDVDIHADWLLKLNENEELSKRVGVRLRIVESYAKN